MTARSFYPQSHDGRLSPEFASWLGETLCTHYGAAFAQHGFDSIEVLSNLSSSQIDVMLREFVRIDKPGHRFLFENRLAELRDGAPSSATPVALRGGGAAPAVSSRASTPVRSPALTSATTAQQGPPAAVPFAAGALYDPLRAPPRSAGAEESREHFATGRAGPAATADESRGRGSHQYLLGAASALRAAFGTPIAPPDDDHDDGDDGQHHQRHRHYDPSTHPRMGGVAERQRGGVLAPFTRQLQDGRRSASANADGAGGADPWTHDDADGGTAGDTPPGPTLKRTLSAGRAKRPKVATAPVSTSVSQQHQQPSKDDAARPATQRRSLARALVVPPPSSRAAATVATSPTRSTGAMATAAPASGSLRNSKHHHRRSSLAAPTAVNAATPPAANSSSNVGHEAASRKYHTPPAPSTTTTTSNGAGGPPGAVQLMSPPTGRPAFERESVPSAAYDNLLAMLYSASALQNDKSKALSASTSHFTGTSAQQTHDQPSGSPRRSLYFH